MGRGVNREGIDPTRKPGRPPKVPPMELLERLEQYIDETEFPSVSEFAFLNGYNRESVYDIPEISHGLLRIKTKREIAAEKFGLTTTNMAQQRMAELILKQLGWSEKQDINVTGGVQLTRIEDDIPKGKE